MSWTTDLADGLGAWLAARGAGTWRPTGAYTSGETAIVIGVMPPSPDRVIVLTAYSVGRPDGLAHVRAMVQVRTRGPAGDAASADPLSDTVRDVLDGAEGLTLGGVRVVRVAHASGPAPLGLDTNGRPERTDNYLFLAERPTPAYQD